MEGWTKLFHKELHILYSAHTHIMIKSWRTWWVGCI